MLDACLQTACCTHTSYYAQRRVINTRNIYAYTSTPKVDPVPEKETPNVAMRNTQTQCKVVAKERFCAPERCFWTHIRHIDTHEHDTRTSARTHDTPTVSTDAVRTVRELTYECV